LFSLEKVNNPGSSKKFIELEQFDSPFALFIWRNKILIRGSQENDEES